MSLLQRQLSRNIYETQANRRYVTDE